MSLTITRIDPTGRDRDELLSFLTAEEFPFHVRRRPTTAQVTADIDAGAWGGDDVEAFWLDDDEWGRVGLVRLHDLGDPTAMIDLRLAERWRGRGLGSLVLPLAVDHVFQTRPGVCRVEGHTREDNMAMRRTFERCGWVREGWFRDGWPVDGGEPMASLAYSVIRRDWASATTTPVPRTSEVTLTGELRCRDEDQAARVREHLPEHVALSRAEPGCLFFRVEPASEPGVWHVNERFVDEAAFETHQRRIAASAWGAATADIERLYTTRGRARDADALIADAWAAEERLLDPGVRANAEQLGTLFADDFTEIGQSGRLWSRQDMIAALVAEPPSPHTYAIEDRESLLVGEETILLTYLLSFDGRWSRRASVWRCDPRPRCVFHQGTRLPE